MTDFASLVISVDTRSLNDANEQLFKLGRTSKTTEVSAQSFTAKMKRQSEILGLSVGEVRRYDAAQLKLNSTQRASVDASLKSIEAYEKQNTRLNVLRGGLVVAGAAAVAFTTKLITGSVDASSRFETALVGVAKTTGLAGQELDNFADRIDKISRSIPVSTDELLELSQAAGQMGVTGSENLEKFAVTVAKLGRASDLAGEEAATSLARILNVTNENIDSVDVLASVIVSLGNNVAATESQIARMTTQIARSTSQFGVSSAEAAALGAAMSAIGIQAEVGGSSVGRVMQEITSRVQEGGSSLREFADTLGLNAETLEELFRNNRTEALLFLLERVGALGLDAGNALDAVGLGGQQIASTIIPLSNNLGILTETLKLANAEVKNATALDREYEASLGILSAQWKVTKNIVESYARSIGSVLVPALNQGLQALNNFFGAGDDVDQIQKQVKLIEDLDAKIQKLKSRNAGLDGVIPGASRIFGTNKREIAEYEHQLDSLRESLVDMRAAAADLPAAIDPVADSINEAGEESGIASSEIENLTKQKLEFIGALSNEIERVGKNAFEIKRLEAANLGLLKSVDPLIDQLEEKHKLYEEEQEVSRRLVDDLAKIESITLSVATAEERFATEIEELNRLLGQGLEPEVYAKKVSILQDELEKASKSTEDLRDTSKRVFADTSQFGIQSARSMQTAFADFLSGTEVGFGNMLKNMAAQFASSAILSTVEDFISGVGTTTSGGATASASQSTSILFDLLDVNRSNNQSMSRIAKSSEVTADQLVKISKDQQFSSSGEDATLSKKVNLGISRALSNANPTAGALAFTGGQLAGSNNLVSGIAGGLATFGGPYGAVAAAALVGLDKLNQIFGDFEISNGLKPVATTAKIAANPLVGAELGINQFEKLIGIDLISKALPGHFVENIIGVPTPENLIAKALFGRGPVRQQRTKLSGTLGSEGLIDALIRTDFKAKGSAFKSSKRDFVSVGLGGDVATDEPFRLKEFADGLAKFAEQVFGTFDESIRQTSSGLIDIGENLNISTEGVTSFNREISLVSEKGELLTAQQISEEIALISNELALSLLPNLNDMSKLGETAVETISRMNNEFNVLTEGANILGFSLEEARNEILGLSIEGRTGIVDAFGGVDVLQEKINFFASNFHTDAQRIDIATESVNSVLNDFGRNAESLSKDEFGDLLKSFFLMGEEGADSANKLLDVASSFLFVKDSAQQLAFENNRVAALQLQVLENLGNTTSQAKELLAGFSQEEIDSFVKAAGGIDNLAASASSIFDIINTETQKAEIRTARFQEALEDAGLESVDTFEEIRDALNGLGKSNEFTTDELIALGGIVIEFAPEVGKLREEFEDAQKPTEDLAESVESLSEISARAARNAAALAKGIETRDILGDVLRLFRPDDSDLKRFNVGNDLFSGGVFQQAIDLGGGAQNFRANLDLLKESLFDIEEIAEFVDQSVAAALKAISVQSVTTDVDILGINSLESLKSVLKSLGDEGGITSQQFSSLLNIAPLLIDKFKVIEETIEDIVDIDLGPTAEEIQRQLRDNVGNSFDTLSRSLDAERNKLTDEYNKQLEITQTRISDVSDSVDNLSRLSDLLNTSIERASPLSTSGARSQIESAIQSARNGIFPEADGIRQAVDVLSSTSTSGFSTREDFLRSQADSLNLLRELGGLTEAEKTLDERSLAALEASKERLDQGFNAEISRLDSMLQNAQDQVSILDGIQTGILSLPEAIANFNQSLSAAGSSGSINDLGGSVGGSPLVSSEFLEENLKAIQKTTDRFGFQNRSFGKIRDDNSVLGGSVSFLPDGGSISTNFQSGVITVKDSSGNIQLQKVVDELGKVRQELANIKKHTKDSADNSNAVTQGNKIRTGT